MTVRDILRRAQALADLRRFEDMDRLLAQVLAGEPDNEEALAMLGYGLVQRQRFAEAAEVTERLLSVNPGHPMGLIRMALMRSALKRPADGVPFARRAVELYPDNVTCLVSLADMLNKVTQGSAEALELAQRAVSIDPGYAWAHRLIGKTHLDTQQYAEAERATLEALRIDPADPAAVLQLGLARAGLGRFAESREQVSFALRLKTTPAAIDEVIDQIEGRGLPPHFAEVYLLALAARGRPDLSCPGAAGDDPDLLAAQGRLARQMYTVEAGPDGTGRAGALAAAVLAAAPTNQDARYVRSRELSRAGRHEAAMAIAEELVAEGHSSASMALVVARAGLRDFAGALDAARRALADDPDQVLFLRVESFCLRNLGRHEEALRSARRAARLAPAQPHVQLELGLAAKGTGDAVLAEQALRLASAQAPGDGQPVGELALLLAASGRWPEAESLIAGLPAEVPDGYQVAASCLNIGAEAIGRAVEPLQKIVGTQNPAPEALAESARWLGTAARIWMRMAHYHLPAVANILSLPDAVAGWHRVPAPPDSAFAKAIRDMDALVDICQRVASEPKR